MKTRESIECWIFCPAGGVLLLHKPTRNGYWQPVTGGIEPGESAAQAACREVREETGRTLGSAALTPVAEAIVVPTDPGNHMVKTLFFTVAEDRDVVISDEHDDFRWVEPVEVVPLLLWDSHCRSWAMVLELRAAPGT